MYDLGIFDSIRGIHIFVAIFIVGIGLVYYIFREMFISIIVNTSSIHNTSVLDFLYWVKGGGKLSPVMSLGEFRKVGFIKFHKMYMIDVWRHIMEGWVFIFFLHTIRMR